LRLFCKSHQPQAMVVTDHKKALKIFLLLRPSLHCEKVDDLNEEERLAMARFPHRLDQLAQPRNKPIVTDAQQRATRNIAHARRFDHEHSRTPFSKPSIPIKVLLRDETVLGRAPWHHRRHPRPAVRFELPDSNRTEQSGSRRFVSGGPARFEY